MYEYVRRQAVLVVKYYRQTKDSLARAHTRCREVFFFNYSLVFFVLIILIIIRAIVSKRFLQTYSVQINVNTVVLFVVNQVNGVRGTYLKKKTALRRQRDDGGCRELQKFPRLYWRFLDALTFYYPNPSEYMYPEVMLLLKFLYCFSSRFKCIGNLT